MRWRGSGTTDAVAISEGPPWVGDLSLDVTSDAGGLIGRMMVRLEEQQLRFRWATGDRDLGCLDRRQVRSWLRRPVGALRTEWLAFSGHGDAVFLALGSTPTGPVPLTKDQLDRLRSRI